MIVRAKDPWSQMPTAFRMRFERHEILLIATYYICWEAAIVPCK